MKQRRENEDKERKKIKRETDRQKINDIPMAKNDKTKQFWKYKTQTRVQAIRKLGEFLH